MKKKVIIRKKLEKLARLINNLPCEDLHYYVSSNKLYLNNQTKQRFTLKEIFNLPNGSVINNGTRLNPVNHFNRLKRIYNKHGQKGIRHYLWKIQRFISNLDHSTQEYLDSGNYFNKYLSKYSLSL